MKPITSLVLLLFVTIQPIYCNTCCQNLNGKTLNRRLTFFDIELLRTIAEGKNGNIMVSPASVKSTLAMLLAGAEGETAKEIIEALRLSKGFESVTEQLRFYIAALKNNSTTAVLQSANAVFASKELKLKHQFESTVRQYYQSEVKAVDFNKPADAAASINNWVSEHTQGLIPVVVEAGHLTPPTDLIVANALYFKNSWINAFNPRETRSTCFYLDMKRDCKMVAMMDLETELNFAYIEDLGAHAVELPYEGKRFSMIVVVPLDKYGIDAVIRDIPYVGLPDILQRMRPTDVALSMPRFTVTYDEDLVDALKEIQITSLFSDKSNLSNMFEGHSSRVSGFRHKVFMSVDEAGTVAAASSTADVIPLIFQGTVQVRADRPFLFFIIDNENGVVLFEGKIDEPSVLEKKDDKKGAVEMGVLNKGEVPIKVTVQNRQSVPTTEQNVYSTTTTSTPAPPVTPESKSFIQSVKDFFG